MSNAVIYCRVSTEEQTKENHHSLEAQERLCREYAARENMNVLQVFTDAGKSASTTKGRNALFELMDFVAKEKVEYVLVQDTDRLARNTSDHLTIKAVFKKRGIKIISISQPGMDDSPEGTVMDTMIASFNQYQSEMTGRKTKKGLEQKAVKGWLPTFAPPGYKNVTDFEGKKIVVIDTERAPYIKTAFKLYITGEYGVEDISNILYDKGLRTPSGKKLADSKLYQILSNPIYYGDFRWDNKVYQGKHEPIVSKHAWDIVQTIRSSRTLHRFYERKHQFILSGFMVCQCGRKFTAEHHYKNSKGNSSNKDFAYYHCTRGRHCPDGVNIRTHVLEQQVEEMFKQVTFTDEFFDKLLQRLRFYHENYTQESKKEIKNLITAKAGFESKRSRAEELLVDGNITAEVYKRKADEYEDGIQRVDSEIKRIQQGAKISIRPFEEVVAFARNAYETYKAGSYELKRKFLGFFWERFTVQGNAVVDATPTALFRALQELQKPQQTQREAMAEPAPNADFYQEAVRSENKGLVHLAHLGQSWSAILKTIEVKKK